MYERKRALDDNIYFHATPHICNEMNKEEEEQNKTPNFSMGNKGVAHN